MRRIELLAVVFVLCVAAAADAVAAADLQRFEWLRGTWKRSTARGDVYETWTQRSDQLLEGVVVRTAKDAAPGSSQSRQTEWILLTAMGEDVFYIAKPGENPMPTPFRLISIDETRAVFENTAHDFPQRIAYVRKGNDALTVTIEGPDETGETQEIHFEFTRVR